MTKTQVPFGNETLYVLRAAAGSEAWVLPATGANRVAFRVALPGGRTADLLHTTASPAALRAHPTGFGSPILMPHSGANRGPFQWRGRTIAPTASRAQRLPLVLFGKREALRAIAGGASPASPGGVASGLYDASGGVRLALETSLGFPVSSCTPGDVSSRRRQGRNRSAPTARMWYAAATTVSLGAATPFVSRSGSRAVSSARRSSGG